MSNWQKRAKSNLEATRTFIETFKETLNVRVHRISPGSESANPSKTSNWEPQAKKGLESTSRFIHENREGLGLPAASALTMAILALANQTMYADNKAELAALNAASEQQSHTKSRLSDNRFTTHNIVTAQSGKAGNESPETQGNDSLDDDPGASNDSGFEPG